MALQNTGSRHLHAPVMEKNRVLRVFLAFNYKLEFIK